MRGRNFYLFIVDKEIDVPTSRAAVIFQQPIEAAAMMEDVPAVHFQSLSSDYCVFVTKVAIEALLGFEAFHLVSQPDFVDDYPFVVTFLAAGHAAMRQFGDFPRAIASFAYLIFDLFMLIEDLSLHRLPFFIN